MEATWKEKKERALDSDKGIVACYNTVNRYTRPTSSATVMKGLKPFIRHNFVLLLLSTNPVRTGFCTV